MDMVNHPAHYTNGPKHAACGEPIECIDLVELLPYNVGAAMKYLWRHPYKGAPIQDLRKAAWYIQREIDRRNALEQMPKVDQGDKVRWSEAV